MDAINPQQNDLNMTDPAIKLDQVDLKKQVQSQKEQIQDLEDDKDYYHKEVMKQSEEIESKERFIMKQSELIYQLTLIEAQKKQIIDRFKEGLTEIKQETDDM